MLLPGLFAVSSAAVGWVGAWNGAYGLWAVGGAGALLIWIAPGAGRQLYVGWMLAAVPIGWTISHAGAGRRILRGVDSDRVADAPVR